MLAVMTVFPMTAYGYDENSNGDAKYADNNTVKSNAESSNLNGKDRSSSDAGTNDHGKKDDKLTEEEKKVRKAELKKEVTEFINTLFIARNKAIINQDLSLVGHIYNKNTTYGLWAYEYEERKMKYIKNWGEKQGAVFTDITPQILIRKISVDEKSASVNLSCSTEYKYHYEGEDDIINKCRIGTYHIIQLVKKNGNWIIIKEWYKDPFGDSLDLRKLKTEPIKKYILSHEARDLSDIKEKRKKCVEYGLEYCGAGNDEGTGFNYNKKYKNYNSEGGDCADFASQMLHEGAGFRMNSSWNVDRKGASRAWVNADGFKDYKIGRASCRERV